LIRASRGLALRPLRHVAELVLDAELDVAAELDVGAAAGHVGGDGDRAQRPGLRHDMRLLLVVRAFSTSCLGCPSRL
jgi:hypothetical protein